MSEPNRNCALPKQFEHSPQGSMFLTQNEVATLLRLSPRTLERHRLAGTGPAYVKLGRRVVYKREAVEAWATANTFSSTSDKGDHHG
jgi:predicted DNA-binding transcriptional regulator AlpA